MSSIYRGELRLVNLDPTQGREKAGTQSVLIISGNIFNQGDAELIIIVPITSQNQGIRSHVKINKGEGRLSPESFARCEDIRSVSKPRLIKKPGNVSNPTLEMIEEKLRFLIGL